MESVYIVCECDCEQVCMISNQVAVNGKVCVNAGNRSLSCALGSGVQSGFRHIHESVLGGTLLRSFTTF